MRLNERKVKIDPNSLATNTSTKRNLFSLEQLEKYLAIAIGAFPLARVISIKNGVYLLSHKNSIALTYCSSTSGAT
jgi:hypothetical protein